MLIRQQRCGAHSAALQCIRAFTGVDHWSLTLFVGTRDDQNDAEATGTVRMETRAGFRNQMAKREKEKKGRAK